jgi:protein PhnA
MSLAAAFRHGSVVPQLQSRLRTQFGGRPRKFSSSNMTPEEKQEAIKNANDVMKGYVETRILAKQGKLKSIRQTSQRQKSQNVQCFTGRALLSALSSTSTRISYQSALFSTAIPEPGPCPKCADDNAYWDGSALFVCTNCDHEWPPADAVVEEGDVVDDGLTRDVNGNVLESGDSCVLTQDLAKRKLKRGQKVKIRLGDYGDGHDCEATIAGLGTFALKSQFLKKV